MNTNNKYILLGGAPKSATTSIFRYLSDHPDVCPSHRKETYFFAREFDRNKICVVGETLADFESYFSHCGDSFNLRLEGTPYTIYAKDAPQNIKNLLQNVVVLFILRDPVKRLVSDYRFHTQRRHPSARSSIQDFLEWQWSMTGDIPNLVDQGCYIKFIRPFIDILGANQVKIISFEDFVLNQNEEIYKICKLLNINETFYADYSYKVQNPTMKIRFSALDQLYIAAEPIIADMRASLMTKPKLYACFESIVDRGKSIYRLMNNQKRASVDKEFSPKILQDLYEYYQPYNELLFNEIGRRFPWDYTNERK